MTELLKYISSDVTNYLIFLFTILIFYMFIATIIGFTIHKISVAVVMVMKVIQDSKKSED